MKPHFSRSAGFTLIEVIIAITIMAFIALFSTRMIQQGIRSRAKFQAENDSRSGLYSALQLVTGDISRALNYRDINVELYNTAQKKRRETKLGGPPKTPQNGQPPPPPKTLTPQEEEEYKLKEVVTYSRFIGESDSLNFTAISNNRPKANMPISDQVEIGYFLENCSGRLDKTRSSQCLWRRESRYIDDDVKEGGKKLVVLENVRSLKFRFLGPGHTEDWVDKWHTEQGEEVMKGNFPYAVEITLAVNDTRFNPPKELGMTVVAPILFPNEKKNGGSDDPNATQAP